MDLHGDALSKIVGDMDDMESKKMFPASNGGATITITVSPNDGSDDGKEEEQAYAEGPEDKTDLAMADGGIVPQDQPMVPMDDESSVPPFLRKKRPM